MKIFWTVCLAVAASAFSTLAQTPPKGKSYLCIPDYSVGYALGRNGRWAPANFDVEENRYLLRQLDGRWWWTDFGEDPMPQNACGTFNEHGFIECRNFVEEVRFNLKSLRFQAVHPYGFVTADTKLDAESPMTPYYQIGKCTPF